MADTTPSAPVRVRFAPSPTGLLHIGGLRTALYNYLLARQAARRGAGGTFILRIEDTDQNRFVEDAERDIIDSLKWAGLTYDEGPEVGGPDEPYYQSQRAERYKQAAQQLLDAGHAYVAFDTPEQIEAMREGFKTPETPLPTYGVATRGHMTNGLTLGAEETARRIAAGEPYVVRLLVPAGETVVFRDQIRGEVRFDTDGLDDQVLLKSDGLPTYHLANVVDDHAMRITHVIRGEEWLPSAPKHILLYEAFGWTPPQMAHLPLILSPSGGKLSKRNADTLGIPVSVRQYRDAGYEPGALLNFLAFLGWNPGDDRELFTLDELVDAYSVERTGQSGAKFDLDKLNWYNGHAIRSMSVEELATRAFPYLDAAGLVFDPVLLERAVALMQERLGFVSEMATEGRFFFEDPTSYDEKGAQKNWKPESASLVRAYADRLEAMDAFTAESTETTLRALAEERGVGAGKVIHPVRLAVSGKSNGPSLFDMLVVVGQEAVVRRLRRAAEVLG